jgi:hypothetical protein
MTKKKHDASTRFNYLVRKYKSMHTLNASELKDPEQVFLRSLASCSIIPGSPFDDAITVAFQKTQFNIHDPLQWKLLLGLFSIAHYGGWPKLAAVKQWTSARLHLLAQHAAEIRALNRGLSDKSVAHNLRTSPKYKKLYGNYSINLLRERLAEAKLGETDRETTIKRHVEAMRRLYAFFGKNWTDELESVVRQSLSDKLDT